MRPWPITPCARGGRLVSPAAATPPRNPGVPHAPPPSRRRDRRRPPPRFRLGRAAEAGPADRLAARRPPARHPRVLARPRPTGQVPPPGAGRRGLGGDRRGGVEG